MLSNLQQAFLSLPRPTWVDAVDVLLVAFLIYQLLMILRGRRAAHILIGLGILALIYAGAMVFRLQLLSAFLGSVAPYAPFAIVVIFQSEIRRLLARIGRRRWLTLGGRLQRKEFIEEIVLSLSQLSDQRIGALVVIERDMGLRTFIESGVRIDGTLSRDLLLTIFLPGSALHDGAVIVQGDRIASAACFLPLSVKPLPEHNFGTRHRAAIGVTEEADCLALIVSEETGCISVAAFGELEYNVNEKRLAERINEHLLQKRWPTGARYELDAVESRLERQTARDAHAD